MSSSMKEEQNVSQGRKTNKTCYGNVKTSRLLEEFQPDQVEWGKNKVLPKNFFDILPQIER